MLTNHEETASFPDLMYHRAETKREYYDEAYFNHVSDYVTMAKRNDGDYMGVMRTKNRNEWLGILNKGFFTYPVIFRSIRSKTATAVSTDIQFDFEPVLKTAEKKAGCEVAKNVAKYSETHHWTERVETMIAMLGQIGRFAAILTERDDENGLNVGYRNATAPGWEKTHDDIIACLDCGSRYSPEDLNLTATPIEPENEEIEPVDGSEMSEIEPPVTPETESFDDYPPMPDAAGYDLSSAVCLNPECPKKLGLGIEENAKYQQAQMPTGDKEAIKAAKINTTVVSSLLIRYDDVRTIGFDWKKAHWFNYHPLESKYELLADHPELAELLSGGGYMDWADSTRWYYELSKAGGNTGAASRFAENCYDELLETNYWFYEPIACHGWTEPDGWELIKNGKVAFNIEAGETIEEACKRVFKTDDFRGLMVKMVGKEITDVQNVSFLDCWTLFGWMLSPTAHTPNGDERLIQLQDAATRIFTMIYSCVQKMSVPKGWADGRVWNKQDLLDNQPGKWMIAKMDIVPEDLKGGIANSLGYVQPPNPSNLVEYFINLIIQIVKEESGIFDETVGANNAQNQTASGRATALNQSLNLLTPTQKAKKDGKIAWTILMLKIWQQMPDEAFCLIKGTYEEEWKSSDIAAFKALDVEAELLITAIEGTDIPKTQPQQLMNFQTAAGLGLLAPNPMIEPELQQYILKNVLGIDFDMNNLEADRRLAERRLEAMHIVIDEFAEGWGVGYDQMIVIEMDEITGAPVRKLHEEVILTLAQDLRTKPRQEDNHAAFSGFYIDRLKGVTGGREPREIDVLILEWALDSHYQIIAQKAALEQQASAVASGANVQNSQGEINTNDTTSTSGNNSSSK